MAWDAQALDTAAWALRNAADKLDDTIRRLRSGVEWQIIQSAQGWKGPSADLYMNGTRDRYDRMRRTSDRMRALAGQMNRAARDLRNEEETRRRAAAR